MTIRAHFDGKVIVPDEPVNLPVNSTVAIEVALAQPVPPRLPASARKAAWDEFFARRASAAQLSAESLRREYIYGDE